MRSRYLTTRAFVLHKSAQDKKYADILLFTEELGKVWIKASGVQSAKSKRAAQLEPLQEIKVELYYAGGTMPMVTHVDILDAYSGIKAEYEQLNIGYALMEIIHKLLPYEEKNPQVYALIGEILEALQNTPKRMELFLLMHIRLLNVLGYLHDVTHCMECELHLSKAERVFMDPEVLTVFCSQCTIGQMSLEPVELDIVKVIVFYARETVSRSLDLAIPDVVLQKTQGLVSRALQSLIGMPLVSAALL